METELNLLLDESLASCELREQHTFDAFAGAKSDLVLFGAGGLGRKLLARLRDSGIEPLAFADNKLAGQVRDGLHVYSPPEAARKFGQSAVFVVSIWASWADPMLDQIRSLREVGAESVVSFIPLLWKFPDLLPHTQIDLPSRVLEQREDIRRCFDLWSDGASQREFVSQLRWRLYADFECLNPAIPNPYFQNDLIELRGDAVFVDAGAFDGDTLSQLNSFTNGRFHAAYAFEPDPANVQALRKRVDAMPEDIRSRIHIFENAVAEREYSVPFQGGVGEGSAPGYGNQAVVCVALDDVLPEAPDFIKFDIEGFELLGLAGAE